MLAVQFRHVFFRSGIGAGFRLIAHQLLVILIDPTRQVFQMKIGVIGAGRMGALHARTLAGLGGHSLLIHDADQGAADRLAVAVGGVTAASLAGVVSEADAVVVATPATARVDTLRLAVAAGIPVFCEKPLAATVDEARDIAEMAALHGAGIHVGFQRRCDPEYRVLRSLISSGRLGRILVVRCTAFDRLPPATGYEQTSGDIFSDCLIHDIDAVSWLTGQRTIAVQADKVRLQDDGGDEGEAGVEVATLVLTLSGGTRAVLSASRLDPNGYDHRVEVLGTRNSLAAGLNRRTPLTRVRQSGRGAAVEEAPQAAFMDFTDRFETAYAEEMRAFLQMAEHGEPSPCDAWEALAAQEVAAAASRSALSGTRVALTYDRGYASTALPH